MTDKIVNTGLDVALNAVFAERNLHVLDIFTAASGYLHDYHIGVVGVSSSPRNWRSESRMSESGEGKTGKR